MDALAATAAVRALFTLLHDEAPAAEFEAVVDSVRAADIGPALLTEVDAAYATAMRLRDTLREHRRREAELAALNETIGDLAALRDVDAVLTAIVHRARSLLGSDTAYLSLQDTDAGDTYVRVTAGAVSPRFRQLRMAIGDGIGGLVAERGTPFVTADYFADTSFRHTSPLDEGVGDEGLVAMLAVPLVVDDTVIGVLWASDRRPRVFRPGEVSLLTALAAHASVAIDNANLLAETRSAIAELADAHAGARAHSASIERAAAAHDRFTGLVLAGAGVDDVVRAVGELVGGDASVLLGPDAGSAMDAADPDFAAARARALATGRGARVGNVDVVPVAAGTEWFGVLVRRGESDPPDSTASDMRTLERAAMIVALLLFFRRSADEAEHRLAGELVRDILAAPSRDRRAIADRAARFGADLNRPHVVVVVQVPGADRSRVASAAWHLAATSAGMAGEIDEGVVLLLPETDPSASARRAATEIGHALGRPATAGAAGPAPDLDTIVDRYAEAGRCVAALHALGRSGQGASADELGFLGVLLADTKDIAGFVHTTLGPLLDYDATRGAELTRTAAAYFDSGRSLARTRKVLHIHINTVTQRLDRIASLLGADWREPDRELQIRLALHLRGMLPK